MAEPLSLPPVPEPPKGERLKNKVVLLTGAAQGIGEAIVATFASQQARLIISDIQGEKVEKVAAQWRAKGFDVQALKADVSNQQDLHAMARLAIERHGRIDVLVNCAGVNVFRDPLEMT
jgi:NAD(P)-dependent dehydrogenase (short-subunit alcohol dehydrogenase family)